MIEDLINADATTRAAIALLQIASASLVRVYQGRPDQDDVHEAIFRIEKVAADAQGALLPIINTIAAAHIAYGSGDPS
jgi:hypothetical protein